MMPAEITVLLLAIALAAYGLWGGFVALGLRRRIIALEEQGNRNTLRIDAWEREAGARARPRTPATP